MEPETARNGTGDSSPLCGSEKQALSLDEIWVFITMRLSLCFYQFELH